MENLINISHLNSTGKESVLALKETLMSNEARFNELGNKIKIPNLILIAGNGRNVGKTTLACKIITLFAKETEVVGLKISPHFHYVNETDIVYRNKHVVIVNENKINSKDSSLMLQAGAKKVYFVMAKPEYLHEAVEHLVNILPNSLIVCESGGLNDWVTPGMFIMVKRKDEEIIKIHFLQHSPIIVDNDGENFDFQVQQLEFKNNQISIKNNNGKV